jgi:hypothetical protein
MAASMVMVKVEGVYGENRRATARGPSEPPRPGESALELFRTSSSETWWKSA